ncbi:MAG: hypothetical protein RLZ35_169 [Pseudomonadota bacterium]|jgi:CPA2 family monovalent cation:H+ antiporter-2
MENVQNLADFEKVLLLLGCAVGVVALFRRISLPPILGYLCVGAFIGPGGLGFINDVNELNFLAEFGVVFLMFTIGLEFSIPHLITMKKTLLGLGGTQMVACTALATFVGWLFHMPLKTAFITSGALALSSTAVVMNQLSQQNEIHSTHSRAAISILLFQDIAAVLFLIIIPAMADIPQAQAHSLGYSLSIALVKGILVFLVMAVAGKWILRPLFHEVAKSYSSELFMLAVLLTALSSAWLTHHLGLSLALGAFLAGMMLGETEFRQQIEIDIRPFRDVLLGLFFITIGALLNLRELPKHLHWVLIILGSIIALKTIIITVLTRTIEKVPKFTALRTGIILAQGGEFGFAVLTLAISYQLIDPSYSQVVIAAVVLSITVAPILIRYNKVIANWFFKKKVTTSITEEPHDFPLSTHAAELKDHVILCGFGRVGQVLARFLEQEKIPTIALDLDPERIASSSLAGEQAFFGDVRRADTLAAAGLGRARMVVISFSDEASALETLKHIRALRADVPVFVRTRNDSNLEAFQAAGATEVVPESLEASLMLASHLLLTLGVPPTKIVNKIRAVHADRYRIMKGFFKGHDDAMALGDKEGSRFSLHPITITDKAYAVGKQIAEIITPDSLGEWPVKAMIRGKKRHTEPSVETRLKAGDVLIIYATPEQITLIEEHILRGTEY